jgi:hypothetical protein
MKQEHFFQSQRSADTRGPAQTTHSPHAHGKAERWHDEVARTAYFIYLNEGCPEGRKLQHWLEAEKQTATAATQS